MISTRYNLKLITKISFFLIIIFLICRKIDFINFIKIIKSANIYYLIISLIIINFMQIISAFRMRYYFIKIGIELKKHFAIKLFFVSMLYNVILPGGIGGDAYKIYIVNKLHNKGKINILKSVISNRINGLLLLFIYLIILSFAVDENKYQIKLYLISTSIIYSIIYLVFAKKILNESFDIILISTIYSGLIQLFGILSIYMILKSININDNLINYLIIFLVSSILSILPISIGGAGIRELSFIYGAKYIDINVNIGITVGFLYFVINLVNSLFGIFYINEIK